MAFSRTSAFGIEYNPRANRNDESFPWLVVLSSVFIVVLIAFIIHKVRTHNLELAPEPAVASAHSEPLATNSAPARVTVNYDGDTHGRPAVVKTLLDRLATAEANKDVEMAIDTIERLRALPGSPVGDLDDKFARRLGALNYKKLFTLKARQWVKEVTVRRRDNAARIARENGATYASTLKLNGGNLETIRPGDKLLVMNHPRFNLVVHAKLKYAELFLQGKFFKRYYLTEETTVKTANASLNGIPFNSRDREEIISLLPSESTVLISEF